MGLEFCNSRIKPSVSSAAEMMEQNVVSQALNTMVRRHQHFDWGDLAIAGAAGGIIGSNAGRKVSGVVKSLDKTGIVNSHVNALTTAGVQSAATGAQFSATQVVEDNMGHSMGNAVVNLEVNSGPEVVEGKEVYNAEDKSLKEAYQNYQASQLEGGGYIPSDDPTGYKRLSFHSDLVGSSNNTNEIPRYESKIYWSESLHGVERYINNFEESADSRHLSLNKHESDYMRGELSMKSETGKDKSQYLLASGVVSSGEQDDGGISYGAYQLSSAAGTVQKFLKNEGANWASEFDGLDPQKKGEFGDKWRDVAVREGDAFFKAQHAFIERTHYNETRNYVLRKTGLDVNDQPLAVQDAVWSAAVQHARAKLFLVKAVNSVRGIEPLGRRYAHELINAIYDKRIEYVSSLNIQQKNTLIHQRYPDERLRALAMLERS